MTQSQHPGHPRQPQQQPRHPPNSRHPRHTGYPRHPPANPNPSPNQGSNQGSHNSIPTYRNTTYQPGRTHSRSSTKIPLQTTSDDASLPWPCPPWHPLTTIYEVKVRRMGTKCQKIGCLIHGLTAAEMRDAWRRMRAVTIIGSFCCVSGRQKGARGEGDIGGIRGRNVGDCGEMRKGGVGGGGPARKKEKEKEKGKKKVRWGAVEIISVETADGDGGEDEPGEDAKSTM